VRTLVALVSFALASGAGAAELLQNGDFELAPVAENGWTFESWGNFPDTGNCRLRWAHAMLPDRDFEVSLLKTLHGGTKLSQTVSVPTLDLRFSVECSLAVWATLDTYYTVGCVSVEFLDRADSVLGETRLYRATRGCSWRSSPVLHLVAATDSAFHRYTLDIRDELDSLSGVNPAAVKSIRVGLYSWVNGNG
jgi:hypothetical protein